ncbi:hypothetical protein J1N35_045990 [Gossypium stocksii]|uniref:Uncharacterized protein n=1 Tax=Gossypium stocksii TaxID=47602 RepID=A0A9D3ZHI2_9ROSI|nr:hypothetical protein J1N35_045990 [Gossypium stocksii]
MLLKRKGRRNLFSMFGINVPEFTNLSGGIAFLASITSPSTELPCLCLGLEEDDDSFSPQKDL